MTSRIALLVIAAAIAVAGCASKPKVRVPTALVPLAASDVRLREVWSRSAGNGSKTLYSGLRLSLEPDALYTASIDGSVHALEPATGRTIWESRTKSRVVAGPSVSADLVLVGTLEGEVIALNRADGAERWRALLPGEVLAAPSGGGNVIVARAADGRQFGLSADDGSRIWSFDRTIPNLTLRGLSRPLVLGNRVYTGLDSGKLVALNLLDGAPAWEQNISVPTGRSELERLTDIDADLLAADNGIYAVTYGNDIALLDPTRGESRWRRSIKSYTGMAASDKALYVTDNDGVLWALDPDTGAVVWKQESLKFRRLSPPAAVGSHVIAADFEGYVHVFDRGDGRDVARVNLGGDAVIAPPVSDGERIYVLDMDGEVAAYRLEAAKP